MASLENLRKQAKQILRWHRDRYFPVAVQIRQASPRLRDLTDSEILDHPMKLVDAQNVVARQRGFEDWQALKQGLEAMTTSTNSETTQARLLTAEPQLLVTDMQRAIDFYTGKLGFQVVFVYGDPPYYGQVRRDGAALNLRHVDRSPIDDAVRVREQLLSAALTVDRIKLLFLEVQAAGVTFFQPLKTEPWGARNFIIADPDGNLVLFAGSAD